MNPAQLPASLENDASLLARFRRGEPEVLEAVYRAHVHRLERRIRRRLSALCPVEHATEAADLLQEVFLRAFSPPSRHSYDGVGPYVRYLNAIARHVLADRCRRRPREILAGEDTLERAAAELDSPGLLPDACELGRVKRYLAALPEELRAVHEARNWHGFSQRKAAAWLGVSRQNLRTMETKLHQGLRRALTPSRSAGA